MNLSKVKLVVSDMDGTLLNSKGKVSNLFFKLFYQLQKHNIIFCAASGRQHNSIVHKLAPIKNDIYVIAENGGIAKNKNQLLLSTPISKEKIKKILPVLRTIQNTDIVLCSENSAFIESKNQAFIDMFQEYYNSYQIVENLETIIDSKEFIKIAIYHSKSSEENIYPKVKIFENEMLIKISGKNWLDISDKKANKGNALREVQKILDITKEETLVFGDYHNDIEMLKEAKFSFSMGNAHKDIKELAKFSTSNNDNFGVERVLEELIKNKD